MSRTPSYRHHKPSNQAVVTLNGKDHYLGPYRSTESKREYDRLIQEWMSNGRKLDPQGGLLVSQLILAFMEHADSFYRRKDGTPTSEIAYLAGSFKPLKELYGHTLAKDFDSLALMAVRDKIIATKNARSVVNGKVERIKRLYRWGGKMKKVPSTVYADLDTVEGLRKGRSAARETEKVKPVPMAFVEAIFPHVSDQIETMIRIQLLTGARPGEVCQMRTGDINMSSRVWIFTPSTHKGEFRTDEPRQIYIGPECQAILKPWLRTDLTAYLFSPKEVLQEHWDEQRKTRKRPVTTYELRRKVRNPKRPLGDAYTTNTYRTAIATGCKKAGIDKWHPHQLRHNAATRFRRDFGVDIARVLLGHTTPVVTEIYAELDYAKAIRVMEEVG